jgi:hypothetical protein
MQKNARAKKMPAQKKCPSKKNARAKKMPEQKKWWCQPQPNTTNF